MRGTLLIAILCWFGFAHAAEPEVGVMNFRPSPEAAVHMLPQRSPSRVELILHENQAHIDAQLSTKRTPWVQEMTAWSMGDGTWFMVVDLSRTDLEVRLKHVAPRWELRFIPGDGSRKGGKETVSVDKFLAGESERKLGQRTSASLHPLDGDMGLARLNAVNYNPSYPRWRRPRGRSAEAILLTEPVGDPMLAVDRYRHVLTSSRVPRFKAQALYLLGLAHLQAGLAREANYYLRRLDEFEGHFPPIHGRLAQAHAAVAAGEKEEAFNRCQEAASAGAREVHVLECLGIVALQTGTPAPAEIGRALAARTSRAETLFLAAQLLQQDYYHEEAAVVLSGVVPLLGGKLGAMARFNLGDSLFATGDLPGARREWDTVGRKWQTDGVGKAQGILVQERLRMRAMVDAGAAEWPEFLSGLYRAARKESMAGAEALYTLSQVSATLGNFEGAAGHLAELLERYGDELMGSELPIQLWSLSSRRMAQLQGAGRNLELAAFYRDHYIPRFLRPHVEDTAPLEAVAAALEELGLYGEALEVSREIFAIHTSQGLDEPGALVHLAQLYGLSGRNQECLETLAYTRSLPARDIAPWHGEMLLLEGEVLRDLGRMEEAASSWREATGHKTVRQEARSRLALHEASEGQCEAAIPELTGLVALPLEDAPESVLDGRAWLALARCHLSLNQLDEALLAAQEAAGRSDDRLHKRYATYFAYLAAEGQGMTSEALKSDDDLWAALGREDEAHVSFESELENYRKR